LDARVRSSDGPVAAVAMVVPGTGEIRALAASRGDAGHRLQQGTTAMAYTLAAALASGLRYDDGFPHTRGYRATGYAAFKNCRGEPVADPAFTITNPGSERRDGEFVTLRSGTRETLPTFFMQLEEKAGLCETVRTAQKLGLARSDGRLSEFSTFTFGIDEVDVIAVANSYATLAARGSHCEPAAAKEVRDAAGKVLHAFAPRCEQALEPAVADAVTGLLRTGGLGRDAAGLTGTTDGYVSAWYAGYTPGLAAAVSLGFPDDPSRHRLTDVTLAGHRHAFVEGTTVPRPIWLSSMTEALRDVPEQAFTKPDEGRFGGCRLACGN
ncbi:MAG: penicillin-binding protein, partial [Nonomuraea sp.]|nr:penicillin-binding protein [Nonomuraea sp.]